MTDTRKKEVRRIRRANWADENTYLKVDGAFGYLFSRTTQEAIGEPTPQIVSAVLCDLSNGEWDEYTGVIDKDD